MTEHTVQNALWKYLDDKEHRWIAPCFTPESWWECDMFSVTKAGLTHEYEIKLTKADFSNDRKKVRRTGRWEGEPGASEWVTESHNKYDCLARSDPSGPSRFWYVVPEGMVQVSELPAWAGLIWITAGHDGDFQFSVIKEAPKLHGGKLTPEMRATMGEMFYWRYWRMRRRAPISNSVEKSPCA